MIAPEGFTPNPDDFDPKVALHDLHALGRWIFLAGMVTLDDMNWLSLSEQINGKNRVTNAVSAGLMLEVIHIDEETMALTLTPKGLKTFKDMEEDPENTSKTYPRIIAILKNPDFSMASLLKYLVEHDGDFGIALWACGDLSMLRRLGMIT